MNRVREQVIEFLDRPKTGPSKAYAFASLILIFVTVFQAVLEVKNQTFVAE
jgi:hypothetical protein